MKQNTKKIMMLTLGPVLGALAGYIYWYYVGCMSGGCSITSSPINSSLYGGIMGALLLSFFKKNAHVDKVAS